MPPVEYVFYFFGGIIVAVGIWKGIVILWGMGNSRDEARQELRTKIDNTPGLGKSTGIVHVKGDKVK